MKKHWYIALSVLVLFLPLIAILFALLVLKIYIWNNPDFWYGYMGYFGTIILSTVTVWLTKQANETNDRLLKIEEERFTPFLEIDREKSSATKVDDITLKLKLCIRNYSEYPLHNIYLSKVKLNSSAISRLYLGEKIDETIFSQLRKLPSQKNDRDYIITCIAGLREKTIEHHKYVNKEIITESEVLPNTENLYENVYISEIEKPLQFYLYMQNINGDIFEQLTKFFVINKADGSYFLTMHSKSISPIKKPEEKKK